ncbi:PdxA family dehydrogenase [Ramlibacter tataouinensis]|uniref:4-hydroxythreonine-4-phosphate dehydrogenase (4-(Phosphohydroxy)-L-threonine dehydrogenase)-like protein n=1 Tax=Ramlibacter tataouinensis (strain ATCC BAA-407 / DSM 14655 / LMG 21543 / TTB310) TaxID=365046 RepID=F5Y5I5_RAMTT|nr:4-hydroxythreonine-4-phosphate dehydrogenase PdxA [Ramlibacter tataouinensis]AEG92681.1 4-hydroxythreonine-4-phosphate dehydrogenase (4- (phosphohydroxy)-L-threonine dehydrogenase)-like protein [Ramlibacter tataouinensis TTB310]
MTAPDPRPLLGLMLGDMTGIGPEISARLLAGGTLREVARIAVIGDARVFELGCRDAGIAPAWRSCTSVAAIDWSRDEIPVVDLGNIAPAKLPRRENSPESGRLTGETLQHMTQLAQAGEIEGISFAPLSKAALHQGGWKYHDEHQMFAAWNRHEGFFGEMNVIEQFSTFRVTSHVALRRALEMITPERIAAAVHLADRSLREAGIARPRIGVAALNPHCGEGGLFGDEEIRLIAPSVQRLAQEGLAVSGPVSSDAIFLKALKGEYDGVVMMYHDQGQIATKLLGFNKGVTVTAGLKTVYTTPAHGTAFDITGQGKADTGALEQAVRIAARMALARRNSKAAA